MISIYFRTRTYQRKSLRIAAQHLNLIKVYLAMYDLHTMFAAEVRSLLCVFFFSEDRLESNAQHNSSLSWGVSWITGSSHVCILSLVERAHSSLHSLQSACSIGTHQQHTTTSSHLELNLPLSTKQALPRGPKARISA